MSAVKINGFSLIELMITVSIIGLLAAIAIPNFRGFQVRARQSEAKTALGAIFSAEKAFYAEWEGYYPGLEAIGYAPDGIVRYEVGYSLFTIPATIPNFTPPQSPSWNSYVFLVNNPGTFEPCWTSGCQIIARHGIVTLPDILGTNGSCSLTSFNATAASQNIGGSAPMDIWTIDESNNLVQTSNGL